MRVHRCVVCIQVVAGVLTALKPRAVYEDNALHNAGVNLSQGRGIVGRKQQDCTAGIAKVRDLLTQHVHHPHSPSTVHQSVHIHVIRHH